MELFIIVESNFLFDIYLSRDTNPGHLVKLATTGKIRLSIPEYSLAEVDGRASTLISE